MSAGVGQQERYFFTEETTPGTLESVSGSDIMPLVQGSLDLVRTDIPALQRRDFNGRPATRAGVASGRASFQSPFQCQMQFSSAAGVAPPWGKILQASVFTEAVVTDTSVTYTLLNGSPNAAANLYSLSVRQEIDRGNVKIAHGCRVGNLVLDLLGDEICTASGDLLGGYNNPAAFSGYTDPTEAAGTMMARLNTASTPFQIGGASLDVTSLRLRIDVSAVLAVARNVAFGFRVPPALYMGTPPVLLEAEVVDFSETEFAVFDAADAGTVLADGTITHTDGTRTCTTTLRDPQIYDITRAPGEPSMATITFACHYDGTNQPVSIALT